MKKLALLLTIDEIVPVFKFHYYVSDKQCSNLPTKRQI